MGIAYRVYACNCVISIIQKSIPAEWCYPSSVNESGVTLPVRGRGRAENDKVARCRAKSVAAATAAVMNPWKINF